MMVFWTCVDGVRDVMGRRMLKRISFSDTRISDRGTTRCIKGRMMMVKGMVIEFKLLFSKFYGLTGQVFPVAICSAGKFDLLRGEEM